MKFNNPRASKPTPIAGYDTPIDIKYDPKYTKPDGTLVPIKVYAAAPSVMYDPYDWQQSLADLMPNLWLEDL